MSFSKNCIETDVASLQASIDALQIDIDSIQSDINALDLVADETLEESKEAVDHVHNWERWFSLAAAPSGETHRADNILTGTAPFQINAGNNDWGSWVQILGSADTPFQVGKTKFDFHRALITAAQRTLIYFIQIAFGATAAGALSSGDYTCFAFLPQATMRSAPVQIISKQVAIGTKVWTRCKCPTQNGATLDFYFGLHEYD